MMSDSENVAPAAATIATTVTATTKPPDARLTVEAIRARLSKRKNSGSTGGSGGGGGGTKPPQTSHRPATVTRPKTPSSGSPPQRSSRPSAEEYSSVKRSSLRSARSSATKQADVLHSALIDLPPAASPPPPSLDGGGHASPSDLPHKYQELCAVAEEMLNYCQLLETSRARAEDETCALRETIRELEKLLDSARHREVNHLSAVEQQREAMAAFDKRYYSLKSRAKAHIKEAQEERDKYRQEAEMFSSRLKNTEAELATAQATLSSQTAMLDRYRDQKKSMPSEKEITQMRLQLRRLEDENGRLATERANLMVQIDELGTKGLSSRPSANRKEMEDALAACRVEKEQLFQELQVARQQAEEYQQFCEVLLEKVPPAAEEEPKI